MEYNISYDVSRFLDASISVVLKTLLEAFILVFIVVYLFLQDFRSTLIPAIAVPVSLIGTFFFMQDAGFLDQYADFVRLGACYRYRGG